MFPTINPLLFPSPSENNHIHSFPASIIYVTKTIQCQLNINTKDTFNMPTLLKHKKRLFTQKVRSLLVVLCVGLVYWQIWESDWGFVELIGFFAASAQWLWWKDEGSSFLCDIGLFEYSEKPLEYVTYTFCFVIFVWKSAWPPSK